MQALPKSTVRKICAGQVIVDLSSAVKELIENSLDACATKIDIYLEGDGLEYFYLKDNGEGIKRNYLPDCAKRYYTSKLNSYDDLLDLTTYGFRGEALNSLCSVSECVQITTKTENEQYPHHCQFNSSGELISSEELNLENTKKRIYLTGVTTSGTEVRVIGLFKPFPVRLQVQKTKIKQQLRQLRDLVISYSLVQPDVRFSLSVDKKPTMRFLRPIVGSIGDCICHVFGPQLLTQLEVIDSIEIDYLEDPMEEDFLKESSSQDSNGSDIITPSPQISSNPKGFSSSTATQQKDSEKEFQFRIEGFIPKHCKNSSLSVVARSSNDRAFIYVNNRPVDFPKISKMVTRAYRSHLDTKTSRFPFMLINIQIPTNTYDINLTPDKRKIFFHDKDTVIVRLQKILSKVYLLPQAIDYFIKSNKSSSESDKSTQGYGSPSISEPSPPGTQSYSQSPKKSTLSEKLKQINASNSQHKEIPQQHNTNNNPDFFSDFDTPPLVQGTSGKSINQNNLSVTSTSNGGCGYNPIDLDMNLPSTSRISSSRVSRAFLNEEDFDIPDSGLPPTTKRPRPDSSNIEFPPSKIQKIQRNDVVHNHINNTIQKKITDSITSNDNNNISDKNNTNQDDSIMNDISLNTLRNTTQNIENIMDNQNNQSRITTNNTNNGSTNVVSEIRANFNLQAIKEKIRANNEKSSQLSQSSQNKIKGELRVIGKIEKNGFIVYDNKEIFIINSSLADEAVLYQELLLNEKLTSTIPLPKPLPITEFNTSEKAWSVIQRGVSPAIESILIINGFQLKKEPGGIYLSGVSSIIENYGISDFTHILEELEKSPSKSMPRSPKVKTYFKEKAKQLVLEQNFTPSNEGFKKSLTRLKDLKITRCPHGKVFQTRVFLIPSTTQN